MYYTRLIDRDLIEWASRPFHKPLLLRGARQVGKSWAVRHLGENFDFFAEINFERQPGFKKVFAKDLIPQRIVAELSALTGKRIEQGRTLLFLDEIQECPEALMSLRFFKEEMPGLHVVAAGSLLEIALESLPTFGVGRIHSMFMYPMTFDEFLMAAGENRLLEARNAANAANPLPEVLHARLVALVRTYMLVGGMPEAVACWVRTGDYISCQEIQDDLIVSYEADFAKYKAKVNPEVLRRTLHSVAVQATSKFVFSDVGGGFRIDEVKKALELLILAGICVGVERTAANGLPLGSEADASQRKILMFDTGLTLRLLNMTLGDVSSLTADILTADTAELVNRGPMAEMMAGLEMQRYGSPNLRTGLYYWARAAKNSQAEVDYVIARAGAVLPVEVKAGMRGGMKSLWLFMREKHLTEAVRCSLENFGSFDYVDEQDGGTVRHVSVCPLYAISQM